MPAARRFSSTWRLAEGSYLRLRRPTPAAGHPSFRLAFPTARSLKRCRLAFQSDRDGDYDIYTIGADGADLSNVFNGMDNAAGFPGISPAVAWNGTRLLFHADNGNYHISVGCWTCSPTARSQVAGTLSAADIWWMRVPIFQLICPLAADNRTLAAVSVTNSGAREIYRIDLATGEKILLLSAPAPQDIGGWPGRQMGSKLTFTARRRRL